MKKFVALLVVICLLIPCFCFSASAADFNYLDYITNVTVSEEFNIVTCRFPASPFSMTIYPERSNSSSFNNVESCSYVFDTMQQYRFMITPSSQNYIYLGNLPDDTELNVYLDIASFDYDSSSPRPERTWTMDIADADGRFYYYDANHQVLNDYTNYEVAAGWLDPEGVTDQYMLQGFIFDNPDQDSPIVDESYFVRPRLFLFGVQFNDLMGSDTVSVEFHVTEYEIVFFIDSLILGGDYDKILDKINDHLKDQGKQIDTLTGEITRIPVPQAPSGSDIVGDILDSEGNLTGYAQSNLHVIDSYMNGISGILADLSPSLLATTTFLNQIINLEPVRSLFVIAVCVGLLGLVLNLGASAIRNEALSKQRKERADAAIASEAAFRQKVLDKLDSKK